MHRRVTIVLSGAGGVGKGAIARRLIERDGQLWLSRSWTSRERRTDDAPDAYHYVSRDDFEAHRRDGGFLEWNEFSGNLYGTPVPHPPPGLDVLLEIDVNGGRQVRERDPDAVLIFVEAPTIEAQRARLIGRGESAQRAEERITQGERERRDAQRLGYRFVVNDELETAVTEIAGMIDRARRDRHERRDQAEETPSGA